MSLPELVLFGTLILAVLFGAAELVKRWRRRGETPLSREIRERERRVIPPRP